jgi:hypothetical protein
MIHIYMQQIIKIQMHNHIYINTRIYIYMIYMGDNPLGGSLAM